MLYDNALLSVAYLEAHQATGDSSYRRVVEETLNYVLREMTSPEGAFYCTQDADSEGEEGKFFVWSVGDVEEVLGKADAETFNYVYDVTEDGNWEGKNILHRQKTDTQDARLLHVEEGALKGLLASAKRKLFEARERRVKPGRDEKILTAWNGLMIDAFAQAGAVLEEPKYVVAAARAAEVLLGKMRGSDRRLFRTAGAGGEAKLNGY